MYHILFACSHMQTVPAAAIACERDTFHGCSSTLFCNSAFNSQQIVSHSNTKSTQPKETVAFDPVDITSYGNKGDDDRVVKAANDAECATGMERKVLIGNSKSSLAESSFP
jgi:hypothetical protein